MLLPKLPGTIPRHLVIAKAASRGFEIERHVNIWYCLNI